MNSANCQKGCSSHLYNAIRPYLHTQNRAQPIIGLNSITEVWTHNESAVYFCDVCFLRISKTDIRNHIMGSLHRYNYIQKSHPAHGWKSCTDLTLLARPLMDLAKMVEKREGPGDVQVLLVDYVTYREMTSWPVPAAFGKLKRIKNQQNPNVHYSVFENKPMEDSETSIQELGEITKLSTLEYLTPTKCVSMTPMRSKCTLNSTPIPSPLRTPSSVRPLSSSQDASPSLSLTDAYVSPRIRNLERPLDLPLSQHKIQDPHQTINQGRGHIDSHRCMIPSETQCLTVKRSPRVPRSITVVRPPRQWSPIRGPCQDDTVRVSEEKDAKRVIHSVEDGFKSFLSHLEQTTDPYEDLQQTSSHTLNITQNPVNQPVMERAQNLPIRQEVLRYENLGDSPGCFSAVSQTSVNEHMRTQTRVMEPAFTQSSDHFQVEVDSHEPISTGWEADVTVETETFYVSSQNTIPQFPQTQTPPVQVKSPEDFPESYSGAKPIIGLQAVIKCQSVEGSPPLCCYLCQLCSVKVKKKDIIHHLTGNVHQHNYLKVLHPHLLPDVKRRHHSIKMLKNIAMKVEKEDGRGEIKVMRLSACLFSEILEKDYQWCMKMLNCGASEGNQSQSSFKGKTDITTSPSKTLKRSAESMLSPSDHETFRGQYEAPAHWRPKKKMRHPIKGKFAKKLREPVFTVSLSLQNRPVAIKRMEPKKNLDSVAPEIECPESTYTQNDAMHFGDSTHFEVQTCIHRCPHTMHDTVEFWNTQQYCDRDMHTQANIPAYTHTEVISHVDECIPENQFMSPAQYAYTGQFDHLQVIQEVEPSHRYSRSQEEMVSVMYADCPVQDWSYCNNNWVTERQNTEDSASHYAEYATCCTCNTDDWT